MDRLVRILDLVNFKYVCFQYGDWFLLRQISKNVDQETFDEFLKHMSKDIDPWDTPVSQSRYSWFDMP